MSERPEKSSGKSVLLTLSYVVSLFGVLGVTLVVYSTTLNPGLPILLGGLLAVLWSLARLALGAGPYYHWATDVALGLGLWMAVSSRFGLDQYLGQRSLATYVGAVGFLLAAQVAIRSVEAWTVCARAFLLFTFAACVSAWPAALQKAKATGSIPPLQGTFANPDTFSVLPMLGLCLGIGLLERGGRLWRWAVGLQLIVLFVSLMATGCRSATLGFGVAVVFFFFVLLVKHRVRMARSPVLLALPLLLVLLLLPFSNFGVPALSKWHRALTTNPLTVEEIRYEVTTQGWKAVGLHPILGSGPGTFGLAYQSVRPLSHDYHYINIAHNDPLQMAVETGLVGVVAWFTILGAAASRAYRCADNGRRPVEAASIMAAVLAALVYSLFNFIVDERPVFWAQFLVVGLALSYPSSRRRITEHPAIRVTMAVVAVIGGAWAVSFGANSLQAESLVLQASASEERLQLEAADALYDQALKLQPHRSTLWVKRADVESKMAALSGTGGDKVGEYLVAARAASPASVPVAVRLADYQIEQGSAEDARVTLEAALDLAPGHHILGEKLAACLVRLGLFEEAAQLMFDRSGYEKKDLQAPIVALLAAAEARKAGSGIKLVRQWSADTRKAESLAILDTFIIQTGAQKDWELQERLIKLKLEADPTDLCVRVALAQTQGHRQGQAAEFAILESLRQKADQQKTPCGEALFQRWASVGLDQGKTEQVAEALTALLDDEPSRQWARISLSRIYEQQKQSDRAVALLRDGISSNPYSRDLLQRMGELYEAQGSKTLAINYYKDALRVKEDPVLRQRVDLLMKGN